MKCSITDRFAGNIDHEWNAAGPLSKGRSLPSQVWTIPCLEHEGPLLETLEGNLNLSIQAMEIKIREKGLPVFLEDDWTHL